MKYQKWALVLSHLIVKKIKKKEKKMNFFLIPGHAACRLVKSCDPTIHNTINNTRAIKCDNLKGWLSRVLPREPQERKVVST